MVVYGAFRPRRTRRQRRPLPKPKLIRPAVTISGMEGIFSVIAATTTMMPITETSRQEAVGPRPQLVGRSLHNCEVIRVLLTAIEHLHQTVMFMVSLLSLLLPDVPSVYNASITGTTLMPVLLRCSLCRSSGGRRARLSPLLLVSLAPSASPCSGRRRCTQAPLRLKSAVVGERSFYAVAPGSGPACRGHAGTGGCPSEVGDALVGYGCHRAFSCLSRARVRSTRGSITCPTITRRGRGHARPP